MRQIFFILFAAFIAVAGGTDDAEAKRRGGKIPIVIPGFGGGGGVVKVLDLPDTKFLTHKNGQFVDLGYLHESGGKGQWVGYIGSSSKYVPLDARGLEALMMLGGVKELPPVPERKGGGGPLVWGIIAGIFILPKLLKKLLGGAAIPKVKRRATVEKENDLDWAHLDEQIRQAAQESGIAPPKRRRRTAVASSGGQKGFGRRAT